MKVQKNYSEFDPLTVFANFDFSKNNSIINKENPSNLQYENLFNEEDLILKSSEANKKECKPSEKLESGSQIINSIVLNEISNSNAENFTLDKKDSKSVEVSLEKTDSILKLQENQEIKFKELNTQISEMNKNFQDTLKGGYDEKIEDNKKNDNENL